MKYRSIDYAQALVKAFSKKSTDHRDMVKKLWQLLVKNRQTKLIHTIIKNFYLISSSDQPTLILETPFSLSPATKTLIKKHYRKTTQKELAAINESIINEHVLGVRGQTATHEFDWTINQNLKQLEGAA